MNTITVDDVILQLPSSSQDETVIYPGAGRIKSALLSFKDKTVRMAKAVVRSVKETTRKILSNRVVRMFLEALISVGYFVCLAGSLIASYLFLIFLIIFLIEGAWGAALMALGYCLLSGIIFRGLLFVGAYFAPQQQ